MECVVDRGVRAESEERLHRVAASRLGCEVECGHAFAVIGAAKGRASVDVCAEFDEFANRVFDR